MRSVLLILAFSTIALGEVLPTPYEPGETTRQYSRDEMLNITMEAAQKRPDVALLMKNSENWFWRQANHVGINQDIAVPLAVVAAPIVSHKVSTRGIHMDWRPEKNLTLRPDLDYYFLTGEARLAFSVTWRF